MIPWLNKLLFDETAFVRSIRAAIMVTGGLAQAGQLPVPPWVGALLMGAAVFLGAGERNPPSARDTT